MYNGDTRSVYRFQTQRSRRAEVMPSRQRIYASTLNDAFARNTVRQIFMVKAALELMMSHQIPTQSLNKRCQRITLAVPYSIWSPANRKLVRVTLRDHLRLKAREQRVRFVIFVLKKVTFIVAHRLSSYIYTHQ